MANRAYLSIWTRGFTAELLPQFEALLNTVPLSPGKPGFTGVVVRAVDPAESPLLDEDLRSAPLAAAEIIEAVREHASTDCALEAATHWNLWTFDAFSTLWVDLPQPLSLLCYGPDYDDATWRENGHFQADLGFEHLFTGHGGLLGFSRRPPAEPEDPAEAAFLELMMRGDNLQEYQERTRENIRRLQDWTQRVSVVLPVERTMLWSEGRREL